MERKVKNKQVVWVSDNIGVATPTFVKNLNITGNPDKVILHNIICSTTTIGVADELLRIRTDIVRSLDNQLFSFIGNFPTNQKTCLEYSCNNMQSSVLFYVDQFDNNNNWIPKTSASVLKLSFCLEFIEYMPLEIPKQPMPEPDVPPPAPSTNTANNDLQIIKIV